MGLSTTCKSPRVWFKCREVNPLAKIWLVRHICPFYLRFLHTFISLATNGLSGKPHTAKAAGSCSEIWKAFAFLLCYYVEITSLFAGKKTHNKTKHLVCSSHQ